MAKTLDGILKTRITKADQLVEQLQQIDEPESAEAARALEKLARKYREMFEKEGISIP